MEVGIVQSDISDHFAIMTKVIASVEGNCSKNSNIRKKELLNEAEVRRKIRNINWQPILEEKCPEAIYGKITTIFQNIYEASLIKRTESNRNKVGNPWMTDELADKCKEKSEKWKKWRENATNSQLEREYKKIRNQVNRKIFWAKNFYYSEKLRECRGNIRETWKIFNELLGKKRKSIDDTIISNMKTDDTEELSNQFVEKFDINKQGILHKCDITTVSFNTCLVTRNSFFLEDVSHSEMLNVMHKINQRKGPGIDRIRPKDLKENKEFLLEVVTHLMNQILTTKKIPTNLKTAVIRPIFKEGTKDELNNYRPISILPSIEVLLEEIIKSRLESYIIKYNIIHEDQYGFQKGKSINKLLGNFSNVLNTAMSRGLHSLVLFIDFKKAFDTISHKALLDALYEVGIRGECIKLFEDYLHNRSCVVKIGEHHSERREVIYGVPQGSKLGPLLYIIFSNNFLRSVKKGKVFAYADDTAIVFTHREIEEAKRKLQSEMQSIGRWCHDHGLILNISKTKILHIRPKNLSRLEGPVNYEDPCPKTSPSSSQEIAIVSCFKYLGVFVDEYLTWYNHVEYVQRKLRTAVYVMRSICFLNNKSILKSVYHALGESHLRYGITAWGSSKKCNELQKTHDTLLRILKKRQIEGTFLKINKIYKICLFNEFSTETNYRRPLDHTHNTRGRAAGIMQVAKYYNRFGKFSFPSLIPAIMNEIPSEILMMPDLRKRRKMVNYFFKNAVY